MSCLTTNLLCPTLTQPKWWNSASQAFPHSALRTTRGQQQTLQNLIAMLGHGNPIHFTMRAPVSTMSRQNVNRNRRVARTHLPHLASSAGITKVTTQSQAMHCAKISFSKAEFVIDYIESNATPASEDKEHRHARLCPKPKTKDADQPS